MSVKDLFNKRTNNKVITKSKQEEIEKNVESKALVSETVKEKNSFVSHVDYSKPKNFARYGSAEKYYQDSFSRIYRTYPYDGSLLEKTRWHNESSGLDKWVFDNVYPKAVGHIKLGSTQSVYVKGGPNRDPSVELDDSEELSKQFPNKEGNSNIWNPEIYRTSNVHMDGTLGNTIEFWAKLDASISGNVYPVVAGNENGNRIQIAYNTTSSVLGLTYTDDTTTGLSGANGRVTLSGFLGTTWAHYAFSFINSGTDVQAEVYKNGTRVALIKAGTNVGTISQEETFLNINGTAASTATVDGLFVDEFRFWKQRRTEEQIGRHWFTSVDGGTNTDDEKYNKENNKIDLGVYFKFNEGVTGDATIDSTVLDYSGRISNGSITNYSNTVRVLTSAIDESGLASDSEAKEPIVYSSHPTVASTLATYEQLGRTHDYVNNSAIFHTLPAWIIEEDEESGNDLKKFTQVLSSYFDEAHQQIKEITALGEVKYYSLSEENDKPYSVIRSSLESRGVVVPDLFSEANAIEEILSRGEQELFDEKLHDIKNTIYQNIYNNISFIFKSKGTEKAFRNLIRCFGIDDELVKINLYADNSDYTLEDSRRTTAIKKNFVDFNNSDRENATVYCQNIVARTETSSYIDAPSNPNSNLISFTVETEVIFPKRSSSEHPSFSSPIAGEEQILVLAEADSTQTGDSVYQNSNPPIVDIYVEKETAGSDNVKFVASVNFNGSSHLLKSDVYKSAYENTKWNLAVRIKPEKDLGDKIHGGSATDYILEFYGVSMLADSVENEFTKTQSISSANARAEIEKKKFISIGASRTGYDPSAVGMIRATNLKISSTLFWYDYLSDEEIKAHASDASNFGRLHPNDDAYAFVSTLSSGATTDIRVPRKDTLAMHWDFSGVTTTDVSGNFVVEDLSEGFEAADSRYGWFTELVRKQITGQGRHFTASDSQVTNKEFIYSAKHRTPEVINSEDLVEIRIQDDDKFTRDSRPVTHFFAAEKSMYQVINDQIVNLFATIVEFNDIIGQPINRYRPNYKSLEKFRQMFFDRVQNVPSLEKYVDYYKWIDNSIGLMIEQLVPVSSDFSSELRTMVESHVLERSKYWTKFPTLEMNQDPIEANLRGINELTYSYELGSPSVVGNAATGEIGFNNAMTMFYDTKKIILENTAGVSKTFIFDDDNVEGATGTVDGSGFIVVQIASAGDNADIATEFAAAIATVAGFQISTSDNSAGTITLTQDVGGTAGNTTIEDPDSIIDLAITQFSGGTTGDSKCLWEKDRVERATTGYTSGDANADADREAIRDVKTRQIKGQSKLVNRGSGFVEEADPTLYDSTGSTFYEGSTYATRRLSKPYKLGVSKNLTIRGGANYEESTKDPNQFIRALTPRGQSIEITSLDANPQDCSISAKANKEILKKFKRSNTITLKNGADSEALDGGLGMFPRFGETVDDASADLANVHNDSYGDDAEVRLQGPFRSQWVGGNQHRQVSLSTYYDGADLERPEFFLKDGSELKNPKDVNINNPSARYLRGEAAKRSLNIENIKTIAGMSDRATANERSLGNYQHDYQVVQTSGRSRNNRWFIKDEGNQITVKRPSTLITGVSDYTLPNRENANGVSIGRTEHVFVERFSSPGDPFTMGLGFMDHESAEFSPYNSLNFRNFSVRSHLSYWLTQHSGLYEGSQGYRQDIAGIAAYQKNNRNRLYDVRLVDSGPSESYTCKSTYDNAYIGHQIPRSDLQYSLFTSSIDSTDYSPPITATCGTNVPLRFSDYYEDFAILKGFDAVDGQGSYADFQGSGWRFIRGSDRNEPVENRKENIISVINSDDVGFKNYREPVAAWNKPMTHRILRNPNDLQAAIDFDMEEVTPPTILARHVYSNSLEFFANPNLANRIRVVKNSNQFYDEINNLLSGDYPLSQTPYYTSFLYREIIFPKHRNVGLNKIRERSMLDSYERFWHSSLMKRVMPSYQESKIGWKKKVASLNFNSIDTMDYFQYVSGGTTFNVIGELNFVGTRHYHKWILNKTFSSTFTSTPIVHDFGQDGLFENEGIVPYYAETIIDRSYPPRPAAQLFYNPLNSDSQESQWYPRKNIDQSDLSAFYDSYDDYGQELRSIGQNYGILSEFRVSQHMDKYLLSGDYREKNYSFLSLDGASYDSNRHKGTTHTQFSSKKDLESVRAYSLDGKKNPIDSEKVSEYPTKATRSTSKLQNNAVNYPRFNLAYATGSFTIDNSVNTEVTIDETFAEDWVSVKPHQSGRNAAAKFNIENNNDLVVAQFDKVAYKDLIAPSDETAPVFPLSQAPINVSLWAQPKKDRDSIGLFSIAGQPVHQHNSPFAGLASISLFEKAKFQEVDSAFTDDDGNCGLTVIFEMTKERFNKFYGAALTDSGGFYSKENINAFTFFHANGKPAFLKETRFNHIMFQLVPPKISVIDDNPILIKLWIDGEELFGTHVTALRSDFGAAQKNAHSPTQAGIYVNETNSPHGTQLGTTLPSRAIAFYNPSHVVIGNSNPYSIFETNPIENSSKMRFTGLLDEFSTWLGFLDSDSVKKIYNNGVADNLEEKIQNSQVASGFDTDTTEWSLTQTAGRFITLKAGTGVVDPNVALSWTLANSNDQTAQLVQWHRLGVAYDEETTLCESWDDEFFNSYVHTDNIKFIEKISSDQESLGVDVKERVRLKVNAIKKLLPYDGFYPQDRTVQIAKLFSEKVKNSIKPQGTDSVFHNEQAVQAALQHFFAPGILYNSIKAGIACDWASFVDSTGLEQSFPEDDYEQPDGRIRNFKTPAPHWYCPRTNREDLGEALHTTWQAALGPQYSLLKIHQPAHNEDLELEGEGFVIVSEPDTRLPFESLLDPVKYLAPSVVTDSEHRFRRFKNVGIELHGWDCEGTILTFQTLEYNSSNVLEERVSRFSIGYSGRPGARGMNFDVDVDFSRAPEGYTANQLGFDGSQNSISFAGNITTAELNEEIAVKLCKAINERQDISVIAIPGYTPDHPYDQDSSDLIANWFPVLRPELFGIGYDSARLVHADLSLAHPVTKPEWESSDLFTVGDQGTGIWVIRVFYVGALKNTLVADNSETYVRGDEIPSQIGWKQFHLLRPIGLEQAAEILPWRTDLTEKVDYYEGFVEAGFGHEARIQSRRVLSGIKTYEVVVDGLTITTVGSPVFSSANSLGVLPFRTSAGYPDPAREVGTEFDILGTGSTQEGTVISFNASDPQLGPIPFSDSFRYEKEEEMGHHRKFFLMTPEYYRPQAEKGAGGAIVINSLDKFVYPHFEWKTEASTDKRYENAINNFISEVPRFFLKNKTLTSITSKPEVEFKSMTAGVTYYMDVALSKTEGFSIAKTFNGDLPARYFGPAMKWKETKDYEQRSELIAPASQAAYVPPYFYGKSVARISFRATESRSYSLNEILSSIIVEDASFDHRSYFTQAARKETITTRQGDFGQPIKSREVTVSDYANQPAWNSRMPLESCLELFGRRRMRKVSFDLDSTKREKDGLELKKPHLATDAEGTAYNAWTISTRFECPVLDFSDCQDFPSAHTGSLDTLSADGNSYTPHYVPSDSAPHSSGQGLWSSYGKVPQDGSGIFVSIEESFSNLANNEGSLIDICGFETSREQIGEISEESEISEAVVMIPFLDAPIEGTIKVDERNFFAITPEKFTRQVANVENSKPAVSREEYNIESDIEETTITRMAKMMSKYNLPPRYDFMKYSKDSKPFVIYFFEFSQKLDKDDLTNIWQGVSPKIATTAVPDRKEIIHDLAPWEFFEGKKISQNVRWMVFKVKKKASMSYAKLLSDSSGDPRFEFEERTGLKEPEYSYNYPYDYCSLIEMVKIEAGEEFEINPMDLLKKKNQDSED